MLRYSIFAAISSLGLCQADVWWFSDEIERTPNFDLKYYSLGSEMMDWKDAQQYCMDRDAMLWCPRSKDENDLVYFNLQGELDFPDGGNSWIGIRRGPDTDKDDLNSWKCDCGGEPIAGKCADRLGGGDTSIEYTQWHDKEPNDNEGKDEPCMGTLFFFENWFDTPCDGNGYKARPLCMSISPPGGEVRKLDSNAIEKYKAKLGGRRFLVLIFFIGLSTGCCYCCYCCFCCYGCYCGGGAPCRKRNSDEIPGLNPMPPAAQQPATPYQAPTSASPVGYAPPPPKPAPMYTPTPQPFQQVPMSNFGISMNNANTNTNAR